MRNKYIHTYIHVVKMMCNERVCGKEVGRLCGEEVEHMCSKEVQTYV